MKKTPFVYLIYLTVVTLVVTVVSFSQYSTIESGGNSAVVASPVIDYVPVSAVFNDVPITDISGGILISGLRPGDELVYHFRINNFKDEKINQVLLQYKISVAFNPDPQMIPLTYTIDPAGTYETLGDWTYLGFNGQVTHDYTLTVVWSEDLDDTEYLNKEQQIQIRIDAEQADVKV